MQVVQTLLVRLQEQAQSGLGLAPDASAGRLLHPA